MTEDAERDAFPEDKPGVVQLTFTGQLWASTLDQRTFKSWDWQVTCPKCGVSEGIIIEAWHRETIAICPSEECGGRAWKANYILSASQIRQMYHLQAQGQETVPHTHPVTVNLVPELDGDDLTLEDAPDAGDSDLDDDPEAWWSIHASAMVGQQAAPLVTCMGWARGLLSASLPADGELWEHLHPPVGGSARDAHMVQVVLGLAIYQAAFTQKIHEINLVELEDVAAELEGDRALQLRSVRPVGIGRDGGRLRRSDVHRLEQATGEQWELWRHLAGEVIAHHAWEGRVTNIDIKGSSAPLTERIRPRPGRLGRCSHRFVNPQLDFTWYQGDSAS